MPNIKLVLEYNGAGFHGWQKQPGLRTIQGELQAAIETVTRQKISEIIASGRTDAGVHARAQIVNFYLDKDTDLFTLQKGVSSILKGEVSVLEANIVDDDFHARFSAKSKIYRYTILNRASPAVLDRGRVWFISDELDLEKMEKEAKALEGEHDFRSFQGSGCGAKTTVKTIHNSSVISRPPCIFYEIEGSGFLKQMVRNIVGTLAEMGRGTAACASMEELLAVRDRRRAGATAPAHGLCLMEVKY